MLILDDDRRLHRDRRRRAAFSILFLIGNGKRRTIRRQEDRARIFFVDQFSQALFFTYSDNSFLSVFEAFLTFFLFGNGAYEANPAGGW
jgi:hypothetical protein